MEQERVRPPRRLRTAYALFVGDNYRRMAIEMNTRKPQLVISRLGDMWRKMTPQEREPFLVREGQDRVRYEQAKLEWYRQHVGRPLGYLNRRRKEPNTPRRPASAYIIFKREMGEKVREEMPEAPAKERQREVIRRWRELDSETRDQYKKKASEDKVRFARELTEMQDRNREKELERQRRAEEVEDAQQPNQAQPPPPAAQDQAQAQAPPAAPAPAPPQEAPNPAPAPVAVPPEQGQPGPVAVQAAPAAQAPAAAPQP